MFEPVMVIWKQGQAAMDDRQEWQRNVDEDVAYLQEVILKAAAMGQRLPGLMKPLLLPYDCQLRSGSPKRLLTDSLSRAFDLSNLPSMLQPLTTDEYQSGHETGSDIDYLTFQPPDISRNRIRLVISAVRGHPGGDTPPREIGNLEAEFRLADNRWEAVGMPHVFIRNSLDGED
jgi:hypothetical protein